jgi:hypothetical protein
MVGGGAGGAAIDGEADDSEHSAENLDELSSDRNGTLRDDDSSSSDDSDQVGNQLNNNNRVGTQVKTVFSEDSSSSSDDQSLVGEQSKSNNEDEDSEIEVVDFRKGRTSNRYSLRSQDDMESPTNSRGASPAMSSTNSRGASPALTWDGANTPPSCDGAKTPPFSPTVGSNFSGYHFSCYSI